MGRAGRTARGMFFAGSRSVGTDRTKQGQKIRGAPRKQESSAGLRSNELEEEDPSPEYAAKRKRVRGRAVWLCNEEDRL